MRNKRLFVVLASIIALAGVAFFSYKLIFPWKPQTQKLKLAYDSRISGDLVCVLEICSGDLTTLRPILASDNVIKICEDSALQKVLKELPIPGKALQTYVYIRNGQVHEFPPKEGTEYLSYDDYAHIFSICKTGNGTNSLVSYVVPSSHKDKNDLKAISGTYKAFEVPTDATRIIAVFNDIAGGIPLVACQHEDLKHISFYDFKGKFVKSLDLQKQILFHPPVSGRYLQFYCLGYDGDNLLVFDYYESDPVFKPTKTIPLGQTGTVSKATFDITIQYYSVNANIALFDGKSTFVINSDFIGDRRYNEDDTKFYKFDDIEYSKSVNSYYFPTKDGLYYLPPLGYKRYNINHNIMKRLSNEYLEPLAGETLFMIASDNIRAYFGKWEKGQYYLKVALCFMDLHFRNYIVDFEPISEKITNVIVSFDDEKNRKYIYAITENKVYDLMDTIIIANTFELLKYFDEHGVTK